MNSIVMLAAAVCVTGFAQFASAIVLTGSTLGDNLVTVDTASGPGFPTTQIFHSPTGSIDSLLYLPNGNIVYDVATEKQVRMYNPTTTVDSLVATRSGWSNLLLDMTLEPPQSSFLLSDHQAGTEGGGVYRVTLGGAVTHLVTGAGFQGVAYRPSDATSFYVANDNDVFSNSPNSFSVNQYSADGTTLLSHISIPKVNGGQQIDGLTWDPSSGAFWGALKFGGLVKFTINPVTGALVSGTEFQTSNINDVDGITTDSAGNLFFVVRTQTNGATPLLANSVGGYNIATDSLFKASNVISGLDDLAPGTGLGSRIPNSPVPLPAAVWSGLALLGGMGLIAGIRRRKLATVSAR